MESVWECKGKKKIRRREKASHLLEKLLHRSAASLPSSTLLLCLSAHCLAALFPVQLPCPVLGPVTLHKVKWLRKKSRKQVSAWAVSSWGIGSCAGAWLGLLCWIFPQHLSSKSWKHKVGLMETSEVLFPRGQLIPGSDAIPQCTPPNLIK